MKMKEMTNNTYTVASTITPKHYLTDGPEPMTMMDVMFSYGFIKIMSILWTPMILLVVLYVILSKKLIKRR